MKDILMLFKAEIKKQFIIDKRYKVRVICDLIVYYILFMILYSFVRINLKSLSSEQVSIIVSEQILSYISWFFFSLTINFLCNRINDETIEGTLEQLTISQNSLIKIHSVKLIVICLRNLLLILPLIIILSVSTGIKIIINGQALVIFLIMIIGIYGLSFLLGALELYFKKIGQLPFILSLLFLGSSMYDLNSLSKNIRFILNMIPFTKGMNLIKSSINNSNISYNDYLLLTINSVIFLAIGFFSFKRMEEKSKDSGKLTTF
ncbi:ABC transporter permease, partial [Clostridium faecium]